MANITYTDRHVTGLSEVFPRILKSVVEIFTNIAERRTLRDLSTMDARTLADLGITREQVSRNTGAAAEITAHREIGDPHYRATWK